jgi:Cdc25 family phosphatase
MSFAPAYTYVKAEDLARLWKEQHASSMQETPRPIEIVDVRDDDYEGGHIKGAWNVPSVQVDDRLDEMLERLRGGGYSKQATE